MTLKTHLPAFLALLTGCIFAMTISAQTRPNYGPATTHATAFTDASGNLIRTARSGHISNYDESKVGTYTLPDPLILANGKPVTDAETWTKIRRPELLKLYETEIYGRVPANAPKISWSVVSTESALNGSATLQHIDGRIGDKPDAPIVHLSLYVPTSASGPVPVILCANFPPPALRAGAASRPATRPAGFGGDPVAAILAKGYAYASFIYTDIQPDKANTFTQGVIGLTLKPGATEPAPDEWGGISAWAWGISRMIDYFATVPALDAKQVAIMGHSRLGKTVLWAGAQDPRVAIVYSSCAGEMGSALSRRDYGETIDDMVENLAWQFAGNFKKYVAHWNDLPVDAHMLIALNAPHPVFIGGGSTDQWADPKGEFLGAVAAGPIYRLLGKKDLGTDQLPPLDTPLITGDLGFVEHTGGHAATPADWNAFLQFAAKTLKSPAHP